MQHSRDGIHTGQQFAIENCLVLASDYFCVAVSFCASFMYFLMSLVISVSFVSCRVIFKVTYYSATFKVCLLCSFCS